MWVLQCHPKLNWFQIATGVLQVLGIFLGKRAIFTIFFLKKYVFILI